MNVAYCIDENYVRHAAVSVRSLCNNYEEDLDIWIVSSDDLSDVAMKWLKAAVDGSDSRIHFANVIDARKGVGVSTMRSVARVTEAMYLRFHLGDILPSDGGNCVYVDADTLFTSPGLQDLAKVKLERELLGAVRDVGCRRLSDFGGLPGIERLPRRVVDAPYFNSGLLVLRPEVWRQMQVKDRCYEYLASVAERRFPDQDALNFVAAGQWYRLNKRYNYLMGSRLDNRAHQDLSKAVMIHAAGPWKFWDSGFPSGARKDLYLTLEASLADMI